MTLRFVCLYQILTIVIIVVIFFKPDKYRPNGY